MINISKKGLKVTSIKTIVTIGRQYGSGGAEIGRRVAKRLGIPFYDKELLTLAAKQSGMDEEIFKEHDEKPANSFFYTLTAGGYKEESLPLNHKLFLAQFATIKQVANEGACVILGRCADYALEDYDNCVNIFVYSDIDTRVRRAVGMYDVDVKNPGDYVNKIDKKRASYYNFYSGKKWGDMASYDLSINSGTIGIDNTIDLICDYVRIKEK